jgi:hypothetical protein
MVASYRCRGEFPHVTLVVVFDYRARISSAILFFTASQNTPSQE